MLYGIVDSILTIKIILILSNLINDARRGVPGNQKVTSVKKVPALLHLAFL